MRQEIQYLFNKSTQEVVSEFEKFIRNNFSVDQSSDLHLLLKSNKELDYIEDQTTFAHKIIYKEFDRELSSPLISSYRKLAEEICNQLISENDIRNWAIQRYPSVRVQFPNNISVFKFHRDSDFAHPIGELNNFLAITQCNNTAALFVERTLGWGDYEPLNLRAGELAKLNTSIFKHGDKPNLEGFTRVSIDFRLIPKSALDSESIGKSITQGKRFDTNDYYYLYEV